MFIIKYKKQERNIKYKSFNLKHALKLLHTTQTLTTCALFRQENPDLSPNM